MQLYNYQCTCCDEVSTHEEWMASTSKEIRIRNGDPEIPITLRKLEDSYFDGGAWFICPCCHEQSSNYPDSIIRVEASISKNLMGISLLDAAY